MFSHKGSVASSDPTLFITPITCSKLDPYPTPISKFIREKSLEKLILSFRHVECGARFRLSLLKLFS
jgi:hypothetical protein